LGAIFANQTTLCASFAQIFRDFSQVCRDFARIFDKSKLLGLRLHPRLLHHLLRNIDVEKQNASFQIEKEHSSLA